mmetsp:Transcript_10423/g.26755  ORF Transcript_10423/g.26755 Transcript_10423/m.26755 type:complete len:228 (+) Transcript_10423:185-868(+)
MSRIYAEASFDTVAHCGAEGWDERTAVAEAGGDGFILEAEVLRVPDRASLGRKRYALLHLRYRGAFRRQFAEDGREVEATKKEEGVKNKGFLNKVEHEVRNDYAMAFEVVEEIVNPFVKRAGLPVPFAKDGTLHFLCDEERSRALEIVAGQRVRLKTLRNTAIIESVGIVDSESKATALNFVGADAGGEGWMDKLQRKGGEAAAAEPIPGDELQGVDDDEWDDDTEE